MSSLWYSDVFEFFREPDGSLLGPFVDCRFGFPDPTEEANITEIVYLLRSVQQAGPRFRMLSLGAGPGEWAVRAERAYRKLHPLGDYASINVEADLSHVLMIQKWLHDHACSLKYNAILFGSVTEQDGWSYFPIVEENDWGGAVASFSTDLNDLDNHLVNVSAARPAMRVVPAFSLRRLLKMAGMIDFLHCDIQGSENDIFASAMDALSVHVRMCCISVHGSAIDHNLKRIFAGHGWEPLAAVDGLYKYPPEGEECHKDGQLVFGNPRLSDVHGPTTSLSMNFLTGSVAQ